MFFLSFFFVVELTIGTTLSLQASQLNSFVLLVLPLLDTQYGRYVYDAYQACAVHYLFANWQLPYVIAS